MKVYKLTDKDCKSYGGMKWGENKTHSIRRKGNELCSNEVIHCYKSPELAELFNPIHGNYGDDKLLWECEVDKFVADDGLKLGVKKLTTIRQVFSPKITTEHRVAFAIKCALGVYDDSDFKKWAFRWLKGEDRTPAAASAVEAAARAAAWASRASGDAAEAAASAAAWAAAWAAASVAARASRAAAWASWASGAAARAAASVAGAAQIDFQKIIDGVLKELVR